MGHELTGVEEGPRWAYGSCNPFSRDTCCKNPIKQQILTLLFVSVKREGCTVAYVLLSFDAIIIVILNNRHVNIIRNLNNDAQQALGRCHGVVMDYHSAPDC